MLYSSLELFFCIALTVYITTSVTVAVVRWGHRCEPYAQHMDYYYPAWKTVIFCFFLNLILVPVLFLPKENDAMMVLRITLMLGSPFCCSMMMFSYFGTVLKVRWWRTPLIVLTIPFLILTGTALVLALYPGSQMEGVFVRWFVAISGTMAVDYLICFLLALGMIIRTLRKLSHDHYSNPDDFPKGYANGVVLLSLIHVTISWLASFIGTPAVLSGALLILSTVNIVFLITALSPHRAQDVKQLEASEPPLSPGDSLPQERKDEIARVIRHQVEDEKAYLDSHLSLGSLSRICGVNRTYLSIVMREQYGGFFNYVNRCRLEYANRLKTENPDVSVEDLATASGFGSRQSYYNARRQFNA